MTSVGGGMPVIQYWVDHTLSPDGPKIWKTLLHKSACLSCAWGAGGQKGGFFNEEGEFLQRCAKSVEAIASELQPPASEDIFLRRSITELQRLSSQEADRLGRLSFPMILRSGMDYYEKITWDHKTTTESGNNFVRLNDEGETHLKKGDLVSEITFLTELAHRIHGDSPVNWRRLQDTRYVRQLIAETIPGFEKMAPLDETKQEFTISGRIFDRPVFATASGKAMMKITPLPALSLPGIEEFGLPSTTSARVIILGTGRSYAQHNTVVYRSADPYRGMPHRNCILLNQIDVQSIGLRQHQRVTVRGNAGELTEVEIIYGSIRQGCGLMFYPEVNAIFKANIDPNSGTPAFKRVPVVVFDPGSLTAFTESD